MSVGLHVAGLLAIALLLTEQRPRSSVAHSDRRAEIVLVPAQARTDAIEPTAASSSVQSLEAMGDAESMAATASAAADSLAGEGSALPSGAIPPVIPGAALPQFDGVPLSDGSQVASVGSLAGGGRPIVLPTAHEAEILAEEAARPKELPPKGIPARLSVFGAAATGRSFVFVIDRSESMGSSRLGAIAAAARELANSIESLSTDQFVQVVAYNQAASVYARRELMPASDENKRELLQFVRRIASAGGTEHNFGLQAALRLRPEVIYLFTDGGDPVPNALQIRAIRDQAAGRTQIHCIHFGRGNEPPGDAEFLKRIAAENGGQYAYIDLNRR